MFDGLEMAISTLRNLSSEQRAILQGRYESAILSLMHEPQSDDAIHNAVEAIRKDWVRFQFIADHLAQTIEALDDHLIHRQRLGRLDAPGDGFPARGK